MKDFQSFSKLVHARYTAMAVNELFVAGTDNHAVSDAYLAAFPEGTNPVYLTNTEHDCSCCKNFIRNLGNLITITGGKVQTVWDIEGAPHPYDVVAKAMADYVRKIPVTGIFRSSEGKYGAEFNMQQLEDGSAKRWLFVRAFGQVESRWTTEKRNRHHERRSNPNRNGWESQNRDLARRRLREPTNRV